ncbi:MAG: DUF2279 domain-containing protein [Bacteroidota bacterium]
MKPSLYFFFLFPFSFLIGLAQDTIKLFEPSADFSKKRFTSVVSLQAVGYGGSLALLSTAWYNDYNQTAFHSFDDSPEWLQMDKAGHITTSWYLGRIGIDMMEWSGVEKKKAIWYGTAGSFLYLTGIEMLDGFSDGWGFSWSDFSANTLGTVGIIGQKFLSCKEGVSSLSKGVSGLSLKFSFHQTNFPPYRPFLLGKNLSEQIIKDYNGQSYWLSFNLSSFMKKESKFPKWLNLAVGYGAERMISGRDGYVTLENGNTIRMERYRQYYFSLDIDLTRIKTQSHFLKTVFETFSFIKIPAPALELNKNGMKFHSVYY